MYLVVILFAVVIVFSGCAGTPKMTPHFIDTDIKECREYEVVNKDTLQIKKVKDWPIAHCNGMFAIPKEEARAWKEWYLEKQKNKKFQEAKAILESENAAPTEIQGLGFHP